MGHHGGYRARGTAQYNKCFQKVDLAKGRKTKKASQNNPNASSGETDLCIHKVSLRPTLGKTARSLLK